MLRSQYGIATSSSVTPVSHAEDAQPNETSYKRRRGLPPQIGSTWKNNYRGSEIQRGSYGGSWTQYGIRGNNSGRGRSNFQANRGGNQRHGGLERSTHHVSVPPIATLPDIEYHIPHTSSSPSPSPSMPLDKAHVPPFTAPTFSERQLVDDYHWLHRPTSPSPKLPPSSLKRRKFERQPTHASQNEESMTSRSTKLYSPSAESMSPDANKPLLPGRYPAHIPALHSLEPPAQVQSAVSPITPNNPPSIKQEPHSPSPARFPRTERSLITTSCKFYPIPEGCKKLCPDFKERRKAFFTEKAQELSRLDLKMIKSFFRDDGLVIEWKSKVPVWSDTLLPEFSDLASAIKRAHQINHLTSASPKRKRQSVDPHSRESSLNINKASKQNEPKRPPPLENTRINHCASEIEIIESPTMSFRISPSPTPTSSFNRGNHRSISLGPEVVLDNLHDAVPQDAGPTSIMDVDTLTQPPKPARRMLFKPVHPLRKNQRTISSVPHSTLPISKSINPLSTTLSTAERKGDIQLDFRSQNDVPTTLPRSRVPLPSPRRRIPNHGPVQSYPLPIPRSLPTGTQMSSTQGPSQSHTPTRPLHLRDTLTAEDVNKTRAPSCKDEDYGNAADPDAELVVDLLLPGTPEELNKNSRQEDITEDLEPHEESNDEPALSADEDTAAVEGLATQFLQRYLQLFDVDRLKLEAAYAKDALFSCRVHHVQEPSFSMAGLFAPESSGSRQGFNVSRSRASISAIQKGRSQIVNRLLELGPHSFCPRGVPRTVNYDVVPLSSAIGGGMLLTVHGEVVNPHLAGPQMDHVLSVDQSFVLRKRELEDEATDRFGQTISNTAASNLWPLVAVSHQMTVRDVALLPLEQLDSRFSQIQSS